jgi:hypothetical protein
MPNAPISTRQKAHRPRRRMSCGIPGTSTFAGNGDGGNMPPSPDNCCTNPQPSSAGRTSSGTLLRTWAQTTNPTYTTSAKKSGTELRTCTKGRCPYTAHHPPMRGRATTSGTAPSKFWWLAPEGRGRSDQSPGVACSMSRNAGHRNMHAPRPTSPPFLPGGGFRSLVRPPRPLQQGDCRLCRLTPGGRSFHHP